MSFPYTVKYPIKVQLFNDKYSFTCVDYPQCKVESENFHQGLNLVQENVEKWVCKLSQDNKSIIPPLDLNQIKNQIVMLTFIVKLPYKNIIVLFPKPCITTYPFLKYFSRCS